MIAASSSNLLAAREQMAFTLAFHIPFACMGVAFPMMVLVANWIGVRREDADAMRLARRWSKVMAVTFAVGAVTGTVLSFELGLLWPGMMGRYGDVFGIPFGIEGLFFFTEAIFIAIYIYGWKRLPPRLHLLSAVPIVIAGIGGAFAVVSANSWMNQPEGFTEANGKITNVDVWGVLFNKATPYEVPHMLLAAYMVAGFVASSVYAVGWLRGRRDRLHRLGFAIPFTIAAIATPVQLFVGDTAARAIAKDQPVKFAAMEYVQQTASHVPEWIYGVYEDGGKVKYGISIPGLDSFLVGWSTDTQVTGLDTVPVSDQPKNKTLIHWSFDTMVGIGTALLLLGLWFAFLVWRRRALPKTPWFWRAASLSGVGAVIALWCGWIVTEVGRQPWIVYNKLRVEDAVTSAGGIWISFAVIVVLYIALFLGTVLLLRAMARRWREGEEDEDDVPYGPPPPPSPREAAS